MGDGPRSGLVRPVGLMIARLLRDPLTATKLLGYSGAVPWLVRSLPHVVG